MQAQARKKQNRGFLEDLIGFQLRVAQTRVIKDLERSVEALGITPGALAVLEVLHRNPGLTQSQLADAVCLDRSSVVPLLDKMEKKGLLSRHASTTDRRHNHLFLTQEGTSVLTASQTPISEHEARIAKGLNREEQKTLLALLTRLASGEG